MIVTLVVNSLWQGLVAVALTALVLRFVPARDAATRYAAWFLTLAALVAVPALTVWTHFGSQLAAAVARGTASGAGTYTLTFAGTLTSGSTNPLLERAVAALWIAGAANGMARLAVSFYRIRQLLSKATPHSVVDGVPVLSSRELAIPIATGIASPAIVVPFDLTQALDANDLHCTIEHELAHVRRGDVVANAVQRVLEALFFWNPWVQLAGRRLLAEREAACDDWAATRVGEPRQYARCLAALGQRIAERNAPLLTPGAYGSRNLLVARIERLMVDGTPGTSRLNYLALGGIFMIFATLTLVFQALVPMPAHAGPLTSSPTTNVIAATCTKPNAEPEAINPPPPKISDAQAPKTIVTTLVVVRISPTGQVEGARIYQSSGNAAFDKAVVVAAEQTKYSPKIVNCVAVPGTYVFRAKFAP